MIATFTLTGVFAARRSRRVGNVAAQPLHRSGGHPFTLQCPDKRNHTEQRRSTSQPLTSSPTLPLLKLRLELWARALTEGSKRKTGKNLRNSTESSISPITTLSNDTRNGMSEIHLYSFSRIHT